MSEIARPGREFTLSLGANPVAGVRSKGLTINNNPIDVTSDDDEGWRTLLSDVATKAVDLSVEGVAKDDTIQDLRSLAMSMTPTTTVTLTFADGEELTGEAFYANHAETGAVDGAVTFSGSLQFSGALVHST